MKTVDDLNISELTGNGKVAFQPNRSLTRLSASLASSSPNVISISDTDFSATETRSYIILVIILINPATVQEQVSLPVNDRSKASEQTSGFRIYQVSSPCTIHLILSLIH